MAVFAELASQFRDAVGSYVYAREAFGPLAGIRPPGSPGWRGSPRPRRSQTCSSRISENSGPGSPRPFRARSSSWGLYAARRREYPRRPSRRRPEQPVHGRETLAAGAVASWIFLAPRLPSAVPPSAPTTAAWVDGLVPCCCLLTADSSRPVSRRVKPGIPAVTRLSHCSWVSGLLPPSTCSASGGNVVRTRPGPQRTSAGGCRRVFAGPSGAK